MTCGLERVPPNAKGPSPYYTVHRLFAKVYDKLTKNLDPSKSQCDPDHPNVLLLTFNGKERANDPSVGWMLDELFADQPQVRPDPNSGLTDISLGGWIEYRAHELMARNKLDVNWYCKNSSEIIRAPRKLSAIMLFDGTQLYRAQRNYHADSKQEISHRELADLEDLFQMSASYLR